jgi:predicted DNA binding CopG/RHH family protein
MFLALFIEKCKKLLLKMIEKCSTCWRKFANYVYCKYRDEGSLKLLSKAVYTRGGSKMAKSKFIDESIDEEERALMEAIENGETVPLPQEEEDRIRADIMSASAKNITIRMQLDDLNGIKKMAKAAGMPYQTLINSIIHRYVTGGIVFKVAV